MPRPFKTRSGVWVRPGSRSSNPMFPGSFYLYKLERSAPKPYPKTKQQRDIGFVAKWCKKNKGAKKQYECVIDTWTKIKEGKLKIEDLLIINLK